MATGRWFALTAAFRNPMAYICFRRNTAGESVHDLVPSGKQIPSQTAGAASRMNERL